MMKRLKKAIEALGCAGNALDVLSLLAWTNN